MNIEIGVIANWNEEKGFGFILPISGGRSIFFHINDYSHHHKRPFTNLQVQYVTSTDPKGRLCAVDVSPLKGHKNNGREIRQKLLSLVLFSSFSMVLFYLLKLMFIPIELVCIYIIISVITVLMYAKDKSAAEWGKWRISESTLHSLSLIGGWPVGPSLNPKIIKGNHAT